MSKNLQPVAAEAILYAKKEIEKYGVPDHQHFDFSIEKAQQLAELLDARIDLVSIGTALMDVKLGQAFQEERIGEHVAMSMDAADIFLAPFHLSEGDVSVILNSVEAHHGGVPFLSIEAEICANADCYKFIHPKGVFIYLTVLGKRLGDYQSCLNQAEAKMDEKMNIISLPVVKEELEPFYKVFKQYFAMSRQ